MNLGTENKNKTIVAAVLGVLALAFVAYQIVSPMGGSDSATAASSAVTTSSGSAPASAIPQPRRTTAASRNPAGQRPARFVSLDPTLQLGLLRASEDTKYTGTGRNIFQAKVDIPKAVAPAVPVTQPEAQQGPPPPPPINLKFFGFASKPGEPKRIFLSQGEDVFIAQEGDIVDRRYKIVRISPTHIEVEDVLNNNRQSIPLTQG